MDSFDFVGNDVRCLVPGDSDKFTPAPVLRIAFAVWIPVDSLQGILDPVRRIDSLLISQAEWGGYRFHQRSQSLPILCHLPRVKLFGVIFRVIVQRPDSDNLSVFYIHGAGSSAKHPPAQTKCFENRFLRSL